MANGLSVLSFGFCLLLGLSVSWLVVMFSIWFVCLLVEVGFGIGFVCLLVSIYVIMAFKFTDGVSVGLFY